MGTRCGSEISTPNDTNPTYGTARVVLGLQQLAARHVSL
jgi:hypothetical protein